MSVTFSYVERSFLKSDEEETGEFHMSVEDSHIKDQLMQFLPRIQTLMNEKVIVKHSSITFTQKENDVLINFTCEENEDKGEDLLKFLIDTEKSVKDKKIVVIKMKELLTLLALSGFTVKKPFDHIKVFQGNEVKLCNLFMEQINTKDIDKRHKIGLKEFFLAMKDFYHASDSLKNMFNDMEEEESTYQFFKLLLNDFNYYSEPRGMDSIQGYIDNLKKDSDLEDFLNEGDKIIVYHLTMKELLRDN